MITDLTAEQILQIPKDQPEKLFSYDSHIKELRILRKKWHSDTCPHEKADKVTAHINILAKEAIKKIANNTWNTHAIFEFTANGTTYRMKYKKHHVFELGNMYIGNSKVIYVIKEEFKKLFLNAINNITHFRFANRNMETEFKRYLPHNFTSYTANCGLVLAIDKTTDLLLLQDVIDHYSEHAINKKHAMWVASSLFNLAAFLEYNNLAHNAISPMTVFISPKYHSVALLGGWWYSQTNNKKLLGIPRNLINIFPKNIVSAKLANSKCDRLLIKGTVIACLGDDTMNGSKLLASKDIPSGLLHWLRQSSNKTAIEEYNEWSTVLVEQLGPRKYIPYDLTVEDIYE